MCMAAAVTRWSHVAVLVQPWARLCVTMCMGMWVCVCRAEGTMWEDCANRIIRTSTIEKAILLVTDPEKMTQEELARQVVKGSTLHPKLKGGALGYR